jgi:hypothetical protein
MADNLNDVLQELSALLRRISEQDSRHAEPYEVQIEEVRHNPMKNRLQSLEHHNQLLESLIAKLKENPKKG